MGLYNLFFKPLLFRISADNAHEFTLNTTAKLGQKPWVVHFTEKLYRTTIPSLNQSIWGLKFENPVGLAAGFDKNGQAVQMMQALGFGYVEIGSVTANANPGNPKPRSFRLPADKSIINRLGLNNEGAKTVIKRLSKQVFNIPVGINIAKTHDPSIHGRMALEDYRFSYNLAKEVADYITINISCPNTAEGKTFEDPEQLYQLLDFLKPTKDSSSPPVLIKLSADLNKEQLIELLDVTETFGISGYVATNTSAERNGLVTSERELKTIGNGGLSGKAIRDKSTEIIRLIYEHTKGVKPIIGVGGIFSAEDAIEKLKAGADLLQVYTALVYRGPKLVKEINQGIAEYLEDQNLKHIYQIRK